jgi:hypothetical protein
VVEEQRFPIAFRMTALTLLVEASFVNVVFLVTGIAVSRRFDFIQLPDVAGLAFGRPMPPLQWILRIVVVLEQECFPVSFGMTAFTLLGKLSLMLVVFLVTGIAVGRSLILVQGPLVARLALGRDMSSA